MASSLDYRISGRSEITHMSMPRPKSILFRLENQTFIIHFLKIENFIRLIETEISFKLLRFGYQTSFSELRYLFLGIVEDFLLSRAAFQNILLFSQICCKWTRSTASWCRICSRQWPCPSTSSRRGSGAPSTPLSLSYSLAGANLSI